MPQKSPGKFFVSFFTRWVWTVSQKIFFRNFTLWLGSELLFSISLGVAWYRYVCILLTSHRTMTVVVVVVDTYFNPIYGIKRGCMDWVPMCFCRAYVLIECPCIDWEPMYCLCAHAWLNVAPPLHSEIIVRENITWFNFLPFGARAGSHRVEIVVWNHTMIKVVYVTVVHTKYRYILRSDFKIGCDPLSSKKDRCKLLPPFPLYTIISNWRGTPRPPPLFFLILLKYPAAGHRTKIVPCCS